MPSEIWLLIFSVLVVISVALFRRYVSPSAVGLGALFVTILACVIFAGIHVYIVGGAWLGFIGAAMVIYAVSNLIFQIVKYARDAQ